MLGFFPISSNPISSSGTATAAQLSASVFVVSTTSSNVTTQILCTTAPKCVAVASSINLITGI